MQVGRKNQQVPETAIVRSAARGRRQSPAPLYARGGKRSRYARKDVRTVRLRTEEKWKLPAGCLAALIDLTNLGTSSISANPDGADYHLTAVHEAIL